MPDETVTPESTEEQVQTTEVEETTPPIDGKSDGDNSSDGAETDAASEESEESNDDAEGTTDDNDSASAPDEYEPFEMPEGLILDEAAFKEATELFKADNLSQERAQEYANVMANKIADIHKGQQDRFETQKQEWEDQSRNDKELGGEKFEENLSIAVHALDTLGSPELKEVLTTYGLGNHPEVLRVFHNMGKLLKDDSFKDGGKPPSGKPLSKEERRVGAMYKDSSDK